MARPRTLTYDETELRQAVEQSESWAEVHRRMNLSVSGASYKALYRSCVEFDIKTDHFKGRAWIRSEKLKAYPNWGGRRPLSEILVENSTFSSNKLKKRLLDEKVFENLCNKCGIGPEWNNEPLVLQLDHINGDSTDNRIENLQILCPNCHTQTQTWGSKKRT